MTFLYSEIALEVKPMSFRYYNDLIWYWYSFLGFVPLVLLTIYKVLSRRSYNFSL